MVKTPKSLKVLSAKQAAKTAQADGAGDYETRRVKTKFPVLGRARAVKGGRELLGAARAAAVDKRAKTLGAQLAERGKKNEFVDRRFGEDDATMTDEERLLMRFKKERARRASRSSSAAFALAGDDSSNDDEAGGFMAADNQLTHGGRALGSLLGAGGARFVDESDDDNAFGGLRRRANASEEPRKRVVASGADGDGDDGEDEDALWAEAMEEAAREPVSYHADGRPKTRRERMMEIIARSKQHKAATAHERRALQEAIDALDADFPQLQELLKGSQRPVLSQEEKRELNRRTQTEYDRMLLELARDTRVQATDRKKTEDELAREARARLEALERDRIRRMRGDADGADDDGAGDSGGEGASASSGGEGALAAGSYAGAAGAGAGAGASYTADELRAMDFRTRRSALKRMRRLEKLRKLNERRARDKRGRTADGGAAEGAGEDDSSSAEGAGEDDGSACGAECESASEGGEGEGEGVFEDWQSASDDDGDDGGGDARGARHDRPANVAQPSSTVSGGGRTSKAGDGEDDDDDGVPYTFAMPTTLAALQELLRAYRHDQWALVLQRLRACFHASLAPDNRAKLAQLLQLLLDLVAEHARETPVLESLGGVIGELVREMPLHAGRLAQDAVLAMTTGLAAGGGAQPYAMHWPSLGNLVLLKLFGNVFARSDARHKVVSPAMLLIGQALSHCLVQSGRSLVAGLFLCNLGAFYVEPSARFMAEPLAFLTCVLAALQGNTAVIARTLPTATRMARLLHMDAADWAAVRGHTPKPLRVLQLLSADDASRGGGGGDDDEDDSNGGERAADWGEVLSPTRRIDVLSAALFILARFATLYVSFESYAELFAPLVRLMEGLPLACLPPSMAQLVGQVQDHVAQVSAGVRGARRPLALLAQKPVALRSLAPRFEEEFVLGKDYDVSRERAELRKVERALVREKKGAVRELRRDAAYLAGEAAKKRKREDDEYAIKLRGIYSVLQQDQADHNKQERQLKKPRR